MKDMHKIFEKVMDEIEKSHPGDPMIVIGAMRLEEEDGDVTYPVTAGAKNLDLLNGEPQELAEIILSTLRTLKRMCTSIMSDPEKGEELFDFCIERCQSMTKLEEDSSTIEEEEWTSTSTSDEHGRIKKMFIDKLKEDWDSLL